MILLIQDDGRQLAPKEMKRLGKRRQRSAVAAVELALLAPFMFFLMLGTFEAARAIMVKQILNDAARKGARTGVLPNKTNTDVTNDVNDILTDNGFTASWATLTINVGAESSTAQPAGTQVDVSTARAGLDFISVKVSMPLTNVLWAGTFFLSGATVESETVFMIKQG